MSAINLSEVRINVPNVPFEVIQKDYKDKESKQFYDRYYINKKGGFTSSYRRRFFVGIPTMSKAMKILGACECEYITILDGEGGKHLNTNFPVFTKDGNYKSTIFLTSRGSIDVCSHGEIERHETKNCKEFLAKCRYIRNSLKLGTR